MSGRQRLVLPGIILVAIVAGLGVLWARNQALPKGNVDERSAEVPAVEHDTTSRTSISPGLSTGHIDIFTLASKLRREGKYDEAEAILMPCTDGALPIHVRAQAMRLLGQGYLAQGRASDAEEQWAEVLKLVQRGEIGVGRGLGDAASALNQLVYLRMTRGDAAGALDANTAILSMDAAGIEPRSRAVAFHHEGLLLGKLNRAAEGVASAREAEAVFRRIELRAEALSSVELRATLQESLRDWASAAATRREAWSAADELSLTRERFRMATQTHETIKWADGQVAAMDFAKEAVRKFESIPIGDDPYAAVDRRAAEVSLLGSMVNADEFGRPDLAEWAIDRLATILPPNSSEWLTNEQIRAAFQARQQARGR